MGKKSFQFLARNIDLFDKYLLRNTLQSTSMIRAIQKDIAWWQIFWRESINSIAPIISSNAECKVSEIRTRRPNIFSQYEASCIQSL